MGHGGPRNRSGPPLSDHSERGMRLLELPAEGYRGEIPDWPLPDPTARELAKWQELWRTPQACVWALPQHSWRVEVVALYVRTFVRCEDPEVSASILAQLHRFGDQIGMTTAGLRELGWKVVSDEVAARAAERRPVVAARRMRAVGDGG